MFQTSLLGRGPRQKGQIQVLCVNIPPDCQNGDTFDSRCPRSTGSLTVLNQVQTIVPVELSQVFADCECEAVADHVWGGPATIAAENGTLRFRGKKVSGRSLPDRPPP